MSGPTAAADRGPVLRHAQRASGQVAAIAGMIAAGERFPEVAQQLLAARGSLDSLLVRLVEIELQGCVPSGDAREEIDDLLRTALGRSAPPRRTRARRSLSTAARSQPQTEGRTSP